MIQISYWVNLIPRNCAIPEWLTTCKYSDFWRNEHVFSYVTILVTVSKGSSTYVSACIELLSARVLQLETLRGLTIMLEVCVWKRYNPWVAYLTINFQNLLSRRKILSEVFNSHVLLHYHKRLICEFWDQRCVLQSFTKYFETNTRIR